MSLLNLNEQFVNPKKVSFIGKPDTTVKAHIDVVMNFFLIIVDGYPVQILASTKEELKKLRSQLIDAVDIRDIYLPG